MPSWERHTIIDSGILMYISFWSIRVVDSVSFANVKKGTYFAYEML